MCCWMFRCPSSILVRMCWLRVNVDLYAAVHVVCDFMSCLFVSSSCEFDVASLVHAVQVVCELLGVSLFYFFPKFVS